MDIASLAAQGVSPSRDYNPRKRGRTACSRCKLRKQKCDNEYPICSNCQKSGAECDKSSVRQENGSQNEYTRSLEERIALLESQLEEKKANSTANIDQFQESTTRSTPGIDHNAVGELVGFLALNPTEAPAYVGSSSGLSLAANLGEMVQATVWNQVISPFSRQQGTPRGTANSGASRPIRVEELLTNTAEPPDEELGTKFLQTYLTRIHVRYPFLDRDEMWRIHRDRFRLAKIKREDLSKAERFMIFKLYVVYAIGATLIQLSEKYTNVPPERLYMTALQHVPAMCETRSVENVEAMALLVVYHLRSASNHGMWYMVGLAMRTAIDLGLHRKANEAHLGPFTAQMRRRLFWSVYYLERVVSMSLGRPFSIADTHIDLPLPLDVDDDVRDPTVLTAPKSSDKLTTLTFAIYLTRLRRIDSKIQHKIYRADKPLHAVRSKMDSLFLELEEWKAAALLRFSGEDLEYPMLHYNKALRILIQPFLSSLTLSDPYYHICLRAAGDICQTHKRLHQTPGYQHSFLAVQTVFMAGVTLLYALWTHTDKVWSVQMSNDIRACSTVLFVMGERSASVKKYRDAFELLVNAAMEKLEGDETAKNIGMAELVTQQSGGNFAGFASGELPANSIGVGPDEGLREPTQPDTQDHGVRMAMQLAPWIDLSQESQLWMPNFDNFENLSGAFWGFDDSTLFDAL